MTAQSEALRLADALNAGQNFYAESSISYDYELAHTCDDAADELRRLHALNAELLNALIRLMRSFPTDGDLYEAQWEGHEIEEAMSAYEAARAAIVKTKGESND